MGDTTDTWERIHNAALTRHVDGGEELAQLVINADDLFQSLADQVAELKAEHDTLAASLARVTDNRNALAEDNDTLTTERDALKAEVERLRGALIHLRGLYDCSDVVDAALQENPDHG